MRVLYLGRRSMMWQVPDGSVVGTGPAPSGLQAPAGEQFLIRQISCRGVDVGTGPTVPGHQSGVSGTTLARGDGELMMVTVAVKTLARWSGGLDHRVGDGSTLHCT